MRIYETYRQSSNESTIIFKKNRLTNAEAIKLKEDIEIVNKLSPILGRIKDLRKSYERFKEWEEEKNKEIDEESVVREYIIKTVQFIEQWESYVKREYNQIQSEFIKEKRNLYEKSFEYRLIYNLRNMILHTHQLPYTQVVKSIESPHLIWLEQDYLIKVHTGIQPSFKKELENLDSEGFDLVQIINNSFPMLEKFHELISLLLIKEQPTSSLTGASYRIIKFYNQHQEKDGTLGITNDEVDINEVNKPEYRQTFNFTYIPYNYAYFAALSSSLQLRLIGKLGQETTSEFPVEKDGVIYKGNDKVKYLEANWHKVGEQVFELPKDENIYSCLYMIDGLKEEDYKRKELEFTEKEHLLLFRQFKTRKQPKPNIDYDAEVIIVYFHDETAQDLEVIYSGTVNALQRDYLGNDWRGFQLGDSFQLNDKKVRVFKKTRSIISSRDRYFIGPSAMKTHDINYKNLDLDRLN